MPTAAPELLKDADEDLLGDEALRPRTMTTAKATTTTATATTATTRAPGHRRHVLATARRSRRPPAAGGQGIPTLILDENLIATDWLLANAAGGIKLQVPAARLAEARQLLHLPAPAESDEPLFDGQSLARGAGPTASTPSTPAG